MPLTPESQQSRTVEIVRTEKQAQFIDNEQSNFLYVAGLGGGKSHAGAYYKLRRAIQYPLAIGLIAANTYQQLNRTTLKKFVGVLQEIGINYVLNRRPPAAWKVQTRFPGHEGILTMQNGRQEIVASLENYDALRGIEIADALIDETRDTAPEAIDVILGRLRGFDHIYPGIKYQLRVATTPNGFDHVWQRFVNPATRLPDSGFVQASTRDNIFVPGFADRLAANYGKALAQQEIEGQFINLAVGKAFAFNRERNIRPCVFNPNLPVYFSMDFNVAPLCGVVMQMDITARHVEVLEEIYIPDNAQTADACREFVRRWKDKAKTVRLAGDASGRSRNTTTEDTNHSIMLKETKPHFARVEEHWDSCNPSQFARVQATNALMEPAGDAPPRMFIDPSCERLAIDFEQAAFKSGTQELDKRNSNATHLVDAATYPVAREFPVLEQSRPATFGRRGIFG